MVTIGIAIACYKGHIPHLKALFDSISQQTRLPDEVVVSCSSSKEEDIPYNPKDYPFPLRIIAISGKKDMSENRNIASGILTTDIIVIMDADDTFHPSKIQVIDHVFSNYPDTVMVIHDTLQDNRPFPEIKEIPIYRGLVRHWSGCVNEYEIPIRPPPFIQYGHLTITRKLFKEMKFNETPEYEKRSDAVYTGDAAAKYSNQCCYVYLPLTRYFASGTGGNDDQMTFDVVQ